MNYFFDLDGTLINSTARHYLLMEKLLEKFNIKFSNNFRQKYMEYKLSGYSGKYYLLDRMRITPDVVIKIQEEWVRHIEDKAWQAYDVLYSDTIPILEKIKSKKCKIYFLTNRQNQDNLYQRIKQLSLYDYANDIFVLDPLGEKNKSDILSKYRNLNICMVGDTNIDFEAATIANVPYYILNRGFRNKLYWKKYNIVTYPDLRELINIYPMEMDIILDPS